MGVQGTAGFSYRANVSNNSLDLSYDHVDSAHLMVVDGIRGLEISPLGDIEFGATQTRTLPPRGFVQSDVSMVHLRYLNVPEAVALALVVFLETLVSFVVLECVVGEPGFGLGCVDTCYINVHKSESNRKKPHSWMT